MRLLILKDASITMELLNATLKEVKELYKQAGVDIVTTVLTREWGNPAIAPTPQLWEVYYDGWWGMRRSFLDYHVRDIQTKYGKYAFDHVVFAVDARNWWGDQPANKVWGWNISSGVLGMDVQQVRFDTVSFNTASRLANSVGTLYHELMHSHMHFPYRVFAGARVERLLPKRNVTHWGNQVVHGEHPDWRYIRHKENAAALNAIGQVLRAAYEIRNRQHEVGASAMEVIGEMARETIIKMTAPYAEACPLQGE